MVFVAVVELIEVHGMHLLMVYWPYKLCQVWNKCAKFVSALKDAGHQLQLLFGLLEDDSSRAGSMSSRFVPT